MTIVNFLKANIKRPIFWIVIFATAFILYGLSYIFSSAADEGCPPGYERDANCFNRCRPSCAFPLVWNCKDSKCDCPEPGMQPWGGDICCPEDSQQTIGDEQVCCSSERTCPASKENPDGPTICCKQNEICSDGECVKVCGTIDGEPNICEGETPNCFRVGFTTDTQSEQFTSDFETLKLNPIISRDKRVGYVCLPKSKCEIGINQENMPNDIDGEHLCFNTSYLRGNNIDTVGFCSGSSACNRLDRNICETNPACTWNKILQPTDQDDVQSMNSRLAEISNGYGYYCDPSNGYNDYAHVSHKITNKECTAADCWNVFKSGKNHIDLNWNQENGVCSVMELCTPDNPLNFIDSCNVVDCPEAINKKKFECSKGQIIDNVPTTYMCQGNGTAPMCVPDPNRETGAGRYTNGTCNNQCKCADDSYYFWGGREGSKYNPGCYKKRFSTTSAKSMDICAANKPLAGCSLGTCSNAGQQGCGIGWAQSVGGSCDGGTCSAFCSANNVLGSYYCNPSTRDWEMCTLPSGCNGQPWGNLADNSSGGRCVVANSQQAQYCELPN